MLFRKSKEWWISDEYQTVIRF